MYELKKNGKVFTSKSVGTGPSSYEKKYLPGRGLTMVEKHCSISSLTNLDHNSPHIPFPVSHPTNQPPNNNF